MLRRVLVLVALLVVSGCCCRQPNPCPPCPKPCEPQPPPPPPGGGGDSNCATFDTDVASNGMTRPQNLSDIQTRAGSAGSGCTSTQLQQINGHVSTYLQARNCNGSITSPATGDCAPAGQSNLTCLAQAQAAAVAKDWVTCLSKLQQGH